MKTITVIELFAASISAASEFLSVIRDTVPEDGDTKSMNLSGDRYCGLSTTFGLVRDIYRELPEKLQDEEMGKKVDDFYIHLFEHDNSSNYDVLAAKSAAHTIHNFAYDMLSTARTAISLYT